MLFYMVSPRMKRAFLKILYFLRPGQTKSRPAPPKKTGGAERRLEQIKKGHPIGCPLKWWTIQDSNL